MKNPKAVISSVAITVIGVGIMGISYEGGQMKTLGGGFFLMGCVLTALFIYHELKK